MARTVLLCAATSIPSDTEAHVLNQSGAAGLRLKTRELDDYNYTFSFGDPCQIDCFVCLRGERVRSSANTVAEHESNQRK
jgi:hypothetical protein